MELEPRSLEDFVAERGKRLLRRAWVLTGDDGHAEDLLQTALAKCWGRYQAMDDATFEAYLRTTMHRTYISWWRKLSWRSEVPTMSPPGGETRMGDAEIGLDLRRALMGLSRPQRSAIVLHHLDDIPVKEVAKILGMPVGTVKTHLRRGINALRNSEHLTQEVAA